MGGGHGFDPAAHRFQGEHRARLPAPVDVGRPPSHHAITRGPRAEVQVRPPPLDALLDAASGGIGTGGGIHRHPSGTVRLEAGEGGRVLVVVDPERLVVGHAIQGVRRDVEAPDAPQDRLQVALAPGQPGAPPDAARSSSPASRRRLLPPNARGTPPRPCGPSPAPDGPRPRSSTRIVNARPPAAAALVAGHRGGGLRRSSGGISVNASKRTISWGCSSSVTEKSSWVRSRSGRPRPFSTTASTVMSCTSLGNAGRLLGGRGLGSGAGGEQERRAGECPVEEPGRGSSFCWPAWDHEQTAFGHGVTKQRTGCEPEGPQPVETTLRRAGLRTPAEPPTARSSDHAPR